MTIAEGSAVRFAYAKYASGIFAATTIGARPTGGQILRRVGASLNLITRDTESGEIIPSRQVRSRRRTSSHVEGSITGELSPGTYFDFIAAVLRGTPSGGVVSVPSTGHVKTAFLIERHHDDLDRSRLYEECRATGFRIQQPAEGNATFEAILMGRQRVTLSGASAPHFAAPAAATTTEVCNSLSGSFTIDGSAIGLVTAIDLTVQNAAEAPAVLGQAFPPDILLGVTRATGNLTFLLDDTDAAAAWFENESEADIEVTLTNATSGGDSITIRLPRVKATGNNEEVRGDLSQPISVPFQALEYLGADVGVPNTTIEITDTSVSGS